MEENHIPCASSCLAEVDWVTCGDDAAVAASLVTSKLKSVDGHDESTWMTEAGHGANGD